MIPGWRLLLAEGSVIPGWFVTLARDFTVVAGFVTALTVVAKYSPLRRPVRYVWRHLVAEPVTAWFRAEVADVVADELRKYGEVPVIGPPDTPPAPEP